jgi:hypothetical protein
MQLTCIINAWSDTEDFSARITEIRVTVEKICWKEFQGPICSFWKVLELYLEISSNTRVCFEKLVDCGLILDKNRGFFVRWAGFFWFLNYFWIGKCGRLGPRPMDHRWRWTTVDQGRSHGGELAWARPHDRYQPRGFATWWGSSPLAQTGGTMAKTGQQRRGLAVPARARWHDG